MSETKTRTSQKVLSRLSSKAQIEHKPELTDKELQKVGSLLNLIIRETGDIYLTHLMKLLYLIDEASILEIGVPVTSLDYKVARNGPLASRVWLDLANLNLDFNEFINISSKGESILVKPKGTPNKKLFSEYEIELVQQVVAENKKHGTKKLIKITHKEGKPWLAAIKKHKIDFKKESSLLTKHSIDFTVLIKEDRLKKYFYTSYQNTRHL